ncbi:nudix hydrolase 20 [Trametopsis cervina]|nr:nudix hydrolase 20 [Trametopsis cervina]
MSGPSPTAPQTYLNLVATVDNFRIGHPTAPQDLAQTEYLVPWALSPGLSSPIIGLLRPPIVAQLRAENDATPHIHAKSWHFTMTTTGREQVSFAPWVDTPTKRTEVMRKLCEKWRDEGLWSNIIGPGKWRGESYPVYRRPFGKNDAPVEETDNDSTNYVFRMERAACALFGTVTYGVHMSVYVYDPRVGYSIWVPKRARTKQTWPGYLDNSVAGGIPAGLSPFESLVKEAMEEASIDEDIVRNYAKGVGSISYFFSTNDGWLQPEVEYLYDLCVPSEHASDARYQPKPLDGEVESFELLPLEAVKSRMRAGLFKPNCAAALIDFMIRHGEITPDNEPDFMEIITRLHGRFNYDQWSRSTSGIRTAS